MARKLTKLLIFVGILIGVDRFCYTQTKGFRPDKITDTLPNVDTWETPLSEEAQAVLDQPFRLLGCGAECYAFLSADGEYVLKFFKMHRARSIYFRRSFNQAENRKELLFSPRTWFAKA